MWSHNPDGDFSIPLFDEHRMFALMFMVTGHRITPPRHLNPTNTTKLGSEHITPPSEKEFPQLWHSGDFYVNDSPRLPSSRHGVPGEFAPDEPLEPISRLCELCAINLDTLGPLGAIASTHL